MIANFEHFTAGHLHIFFGEMSFQIVCPGLIGLHVIIVKL
jgi:hypothetical protein